jgi:protein AroM
MTIDKRSAGAMVLSGALPRDGGDSTEDAKTPAPSGTRIGFLTIGQAPRTDVVPDILSILGRGVDIRERGALDGLSRKAIAGLGPGRGDFPLITRLRDGSAAVVGKKKIISLLQKQIAALERQNVGLIALLCTEGFAALESKTLLLLPSRIMLSAVGSILKRGRIAVLGPLPEQKPAIREKWRRTGLEVIVEDFNPYQRISDFKRVAARIENRGASLIVLDCIGYSSEFKERIRQETGKPVLLPRSLLAGMIRELF